MPLGYNPGEREEGSGGKALAGTYQFNVAESGEKTFRSGNNGLEVKLDVYAAMPNGQHKVISVWDRFVYTPKSLWKLEEFLTGLGLDFQRPPEAHHLIGKTGKAAFVPNEKGYLEAETYEAAPANNAPGTGSGWQTPPAQQPPAGEQPPLQSEPPAWLG